MDGTNVRSVDIHGISGSGLVTDFQGAAGNPKDSYITSVAGDGCTTPNDSLPPTHHKLLSDDNIIGIATAAIVSFFTAVAVVIRYGVRKRAKKHASKVSSKDEGQDRAGSELGNGGRETQRSHFLEMPVTEPKELTAEEVRGPELPAQPPFPVYEMSQPSPELENAQFAGTH